MSFSCVLVVGGTGATGRRVVSRLRERGDAVRVLSRSPERAQELLGSSIEVVGGDLRDAQSLVAPLKGVHTLVIASGTRTYFGNNGGAAVDALGTRNLMAAAAAAQPARVVLLTAFGLDRSSPFLAVFSAALGGYFVHKAAAEEAVRSSGLPYAIVRPVELRERAPWGRAALNQHQPLSLLRTVSRDLVADVLVEATHDPSALGKTFEVYEAEQAASLSEQLQQLASDDARPRPAHTPLW